MSIVFNAHAKTACVTGKDLIMKEELSRTQLLLGEEAVERLASAHVAVFGIGGVGGYTAEALARSGIGRLDLIDGDTVSLSNINRQLTALHSTVGEYKADVMARRIADINPACRVTAYKTFYTDENQNDFDFSKYDYIADAIDSVKDKILIIARAKELGVPVISAMGAGNKLDASRFEVADISKTSVCPLARVMRQELRKRGITHLKVVYSKEQPLQPHTDAHGASDTRRVPGSTSFVPGVAGLILAGEIIKSFTDKK